MAFRIDVGTILRPPRRTADGAMRVDATLTRTGVFSYDDGKGGVVREYRPPDEVFDPESLASFEALPVTDDHPPVMVDASNVSEYKRGRSGDTVKRDGIHMVGALIVDDARLIKKMESGKRDVSNGYVCELDMTPGVSPEGETYDVIQRKIRGNHIAVVTDGRAGTARVRMDGAAYQIVSAPVGVLPTDANRADAAVAVTGVNVMNLEQALAALNAANEKLGAAKEQLANETKRADAAEQRAKASDAAKTQAEAKADQSDAKVKAAETAKTEAEAAAAKAKTDAADAGKAANKARVQLVTSALKHGIKAVKVDGKDVDVYDADDRDLRCAVIAKLDGAEVPADKRGNDGYIEARFDLAVARDTTSATAFDKLGAVINAPARTDAVPGNPSDDAEAIARKKMHEDSRNAARTVNEVK